MGKILWPMLHFFANFLSIRSIQSRNDIQTCHERVEINRIKAHWGFSMKNYSFRSILLLLSIVHRHYVNGLIIQPLDQTHNLRSLGFKWNILVNASRVFTNGEKRSKQKHSKQIFIHWWFLVKIGIACLVSLVFINNSDTDSTEKLCKSASFSVASAST